MSFPQLRGYWIPAGLIPVGKAANSRGFTLFEILVALLIIGLMVGVATLAISDPAPEKLREENRRLSALITLAQEEAILQSRDLGIAFWQQGYSFYEYFQGKWEKIQKDQIYRDYKLPENMRLQLVLEDIDITMSALEPEKPQVFILSSGELSPFKVRFKFFDAVFYTELQADALGTLKQNNGNAQNNPFGA